MKVLVEAGRLVEEGTTFALATVVGVERPSSARVGDLDFSPNRLTFAVADAAEPARVVLNQNWGPGWSTDAGTIKPGPPTELATVTIPPGASGRYAFTFTPPGLYTGSALLALAILATVLAWRRRVTAIF